MGGGWAGLDSGKLLGAAAFIREQPQWDQQPIFFPKMSLIILLREVVMALGEK